MQSPSSPRAAFLTLLGDSALIERVAAAAPLLFPGASREVAFLRCLFTAGPGPETAPAFVAQLLAGGFKAVPAGLAPPEAGDLFVETDARRQPVRVGAVAKVDVRGEFFLGYAGAERERVPLSQVDYFLKAPSS